MDTLRRYLLPGLIFQSVIVGGGYATGRELVEFFLPSGPIGGLIGLLVAGVVFGVVLSVAYEFARVTRAFDYRTFCKHLLGRGWVLYEITYLIFIVLVLAVVGSASGELVAATTGAPPLVGTVLMMLLVAVLTFYGSLVLQRVLMFWSVLLYAVYIALFVATFLTAGERIDSSFTNADLGSNWISSGITYAGYNINLPAVLFCIVVLRSRREAVGAGLLTGAIAVIPAALFFVAMMARYPEIGQQSVPALFLMSQLDIVWLEWVFQIVVFGTFVETGAGLLHSINERLNAQVLETQRKLPRYVRPLVAGLMMLLSIYGATAIGIVDLIAKGYGLLTYAFIAILVVPLLTIGVFKLKRIAQDNATETAVSV